MRLWNRVAAVFVVLLTLVASVSARDDRSSDDGPSDEGSSDEGFTYVVAEGDTLSHVAVRFGVSLDALLAENAALDPDRIRAGQTLRIVNGLRRVQHRVERGESISSIAARYETEIDDVLRWNPGTTRRRLLAGRELVIYTRVPESRSLSIGAPARGSLAHARRLPMSHPAFVVRRPTRAYATDETVRWIVEAFEALRATDPEAPAVEVHDLSFRHGGPISGHNSHESGRDVDIAYFQKDCGELCRFRRIGPHQLDARRQWALFSRWIERDVVDNIFVDHRLAAKIYEAAREAGATRRDLNRWFQYPRPIEQRQGIIRHHPRHSDHFHARFVCPESDPDCR